MYKEQQIQEMQVLEQNLQNLLMQKQAFQMELSETQAAIKEIEKAGEEIFKIVGQLMIKADKEKTQKELANKEKMLDLRVKTLEKQETTFVDKLEQIRDEVMKTIKK